jgi:hypothetical protein
MALRSVLGCLDHRLGDHVVDGHPCMMEFRRKFVGEELLKGPDQGARTHALAPLIKFFPINTTILQLTWFGL